jgi:hypothetical protein
MFSSDHMGERAAAAKKADKLVRAAKLTWPDILNSERPGGNKFQAPPRRDALTAGDILARYGDRLTGWEKGFLVSLVRRPCRMSARQAEILEEIRAKCAAGEA